MNNTDRNWMYERLDADGYVSSIFKNGLKTFIEYACTNHKFMDGNKIKCPCIKCDNVPYEEVDMVKYHLAKYGFKSNYHLWDRHGETSVRSTSSVGSTLSGMDDANTSSNDQPEPSYREMVFDVAGPDFVRRTLDEEPNPEDKKFFDMLKAADKELWSGCEKLTQLSAVARLLNIKSEYRIPEQCFNAICQLMKDGLPDENTMVDSLYDSKKVVQGLGLPVELIDCCISGCMIYWRCDKNLGQCKFCEEPRYKKLKNSDKFSRVPCSRMHYFPLIPRLKRLYASEATAASMRWHAESHGHGDGIMCHPSDSEAWKHFDVVHPSFSLERRNVRLGLCTDGFQPHGISGAQHSTWPIIITPYNLPPSMCMKEPYMFLTVIVPGPKNPKHKLDVFLQPVIEELKQLWEEGVITYDVSLRQNFQMRAALMWTISDFPAYAMLSGWGTAGKLACPYCRNHIQTIYLPKGQKVSWFDCHRRFLELGHPFRKNKTKFRKNRIVTSGPPPIMTGIETLSEIEAYGFLKVTEVGADAVNKHCNNQDGCGWKKKSIFWDLPYWKTNLIRHCLDVMHIEKNVFENIFFTIMDVKKKTKDTGVAREDMKIFCNRKNFEKNQVTGKYPTAPYALSKEQKKVICKWVESLTFPDGYVSNLGRCVDLTTNRLFGMKSHDCHVFMQRLMPIAFREMLPKKIWEAITELSLFFKRLTASVITIEDMKKLEAEIPIILCKLEEIFVPGVFNSMEHLPVHLPYEARIAGPVQNRWMYPFERQLHGLKKDVKNKARVEGSICNAYLTREASIFCSYYFEPHVYTRNRKVPRNDDGGGEDYDEEKLSIFSHPGRPYGKLKKRRLNEKEYIAAHTYILLNEEKVQPYIKMYEEILEELHPDMNEEEIAGEVEKHFAQWFESYARHNPINNTYIRDLSRRPVRMVKSYNVYFVNGYKFHTDKHGENKSTMNSGECISSESFDYYGNLLEILEVEYPGLPIKTTVLFRCAWYDPTPNVGVKIHNQYKLVDINKRQKLKKFEPFVLAMQATQVCYIPYPSMKKNNIDWLAVCKVKPRGWADVENIDNQKDVAFQEDVVETNEIISIAQEPSTSSVDETVRSGYISSNSSDDENNDVDEGEYQYSTPTNEEEDDDGEYYHSDDDSD